MTKLQTKLLTKYVSQYSDVTVPQEIIDEKVSELSKLHDEGRFLLNEEKVYENMRGIVRVKNPVDCIAECEADMDDNSDDSGKYETEVEL